MKNILYFYPHKFSKLTDGIHTRIITLLQYFKSRDFCVDMVCFEDDGINGSYAKMNGLVNNIYYAKKKKIVENRPAGFLLLKWRSLQNRLFPQSPSDPIPDLISESLINTILDLNSKKKYDIVLVTYVYWANIIKYLEPVNPGIKKIIDTTDFITLQQYYYNNGLRAEQIGEMFGNEIKRMKQFDEIIHISYDEMLLFSNFIPDIKHHYIPQFFENRNIPTNTNKKYDVLFIASNNIYNVEGVNWFLEKVYSLLDKGITIAIAGNICNKISEQKENIHLLGFVDSVEDLYNISKFTICPLRKGSGIKIKVVESLSYGLPVVTTIKGLDGFSNRTPDGGVILADDAVTFANTINKLFNNKDYYLAQAEKAKYLFEEEFSFKKNFPRLDKIFRY